MSLSSAKTALKNAVHSWLKKVKDDNPDPGTDPPGWNPEPADTGDELEAAVTDYWSNITLDSWSTVATTVTTPAGAASASTISDGGTVTPVPDVTAEGFSTSWVADMGVNQLAGGGSPQFGFTELLLKTRLQLVVATESTSTGCVGVTVAGSIDLDYVFNERDSDGHPVMTGNVGGSNYSDSEYTAAKFAEQIHEMTIGSKFTAAPGNPNNEIGGANVATDSYSSNFK